MMMPLALYGLRNETINHGQHDECAKAVEKVARAPDGKGNDYDQDGKCSRGHFEASAGFLGCVHPKISLMNGGNLAPEVPCCNVVRASAVASHLSSSPWQNRTVCCAGQSNEVAA